MKISAGLMFATGGVLMATTSTGTVEPDDNDRTLPPPEISFNFNDIDDALGMPVTTASSRPAVEPAQRPTSRQDDMAAPSSTATDKPRSSVDPEQRRPVTVLAEKSPPTDSDTAADPASHTLPDTIVDNGEKATVTTVATTDATDVAGQTPGPISAGADGESVQTITVAAGDTLSGILNSQGLGLASIRDLLDDAVVNEQLARLSIGQVLEITHSADGGLKALSTRIADDRRISIERNGDDFVVAEIELPLEKERVVTSGTIQNSLYLAAAEAKLRQSTIMELSDIFQWELDFARDIRKGDQFALVYDRLYRDGQYIGDGDILAAEFIRGGRTYQAVRFTTDDGTSGYYSPDGQSMRRTFLRHPVDVVRVTSRFDPNRLHPVLHQIRAHRGVDYGSPYGTPIRATADGTVSFAGVQSTYGNLVILQHGQEFSTLYAHMSKVADKSIAGHKVKQGDIIGYVGNTGRVTGTHLHYEFRVRGVHVDPLKVELPAAQPIAAEYRDALRLVSDEMITQMEGVLPNTASQVATR